MQRLLLLIWVILGGCSSQQTKSIQPPFLYEVKKQGVTSYLLGTLNLGVRKNQLPSVVFEKMQAAPIFVIESRFDLNEDQSKEFFEKMNRSLLQRKDRKKLSEVLGKATYQNVKKVFEKHLPDENLIEFLTPKVAFYNLQMLDSRVSNLKNTRWDPAQSMDLEIYQHALTHQKQIFELNGSEFAMSSDCEDLIFTELIRSHFEVTTAKLKNELAQTEKLYLSGSEEQVIKNSEKDSAQVRKCLIYDQNLVWVKTISELQSLLQASFFISVGVNHLVGEQGLIELLRKSGFEVTRY
jgi:uncharacterized protein YbaP (TraB family)